MIKRDHKLKRAAVWLPAKVYELLVRGRIAAYETEYLEARRLNATVISVGNISLGGTGKTSITSYIAGYLKREDQQVAVITRGYGRTSRRRRLLNCPTCPDSALRSFPEFGDEPLMMARSLESVPIIVDANRYGAGLWAERELGTNVLVLDDAYQHLRIHRDLNLLLIDATDPFGAFEMVPFGRLREPLYAIKRADAVIVTRADRPFDQAQTSAIIRHFCGDAVPIMYFCSVITTLRHLSSGEAFGVAEFRGWNVAAMCGIGNPRAFADDILQAGINIVGEHFFRDHHRYSQSDLDRVTAAARNAGADAVLTTDKDAVRLEGLNYGDIPIYSAISELQSEDEVRFRSMLLRTVARR